MFYQKPIVFDRDNILLRIAGHVQLKAMNGDRQHDAPRRWRQDAEQYNFPFRASDQDYRMQ